MSEGLASRLLLTDVGHAEMSDIHLPFDAFVVQIPKGLAHLSDPKTGLHDLDSFAILKSYVEEEKDSNIPYRYEILFYGAENKKSTNLGDDAVFFSEIWPDRTTVDEAIKAHSAYVDKKKDDLSYDGLSGLSVASGETSISGLEVLTRFAMACVLYITDFPDDRSKYKEEELESLEKAAFSEKDKKKRKNLKRRIRDIKNKQRSIQIVGASVESDPMMKKAASECVKHGSPSVSSYVRGHRKMQPYGPALSYRKPVWIHPYWRNVGNEPSDSRYHVSWQTACHRVITGHRRPSAC